MRAILLEFEVDNADSWRWRVFVDDLEWIFHTDRDGDGLWEINPNGQKRQSQGSSQFRIPYVPGDDDTEKAAQFVMAEFGLRDGR